MRQEYDPASVRLTFNGRDLPRDTVVDVPQHMMGSAELIFGAVTQSLPDTLVVHPAHAKRLLAAMVVTPEDEARIERAKAKRARKAAARRPS